MGGINPPINANLAPPSLITMNNRYGPLALQENEDEGLDGADAGERGWERASRKQRGGNQRTEVLDFLVEFPETQTAKSAKELVELGLRKRLNAKLQVLKVTLLQSRVSARARTLAQKTQIMTSAQVSINVPSRLRVRWSWENVNGIRADDNDEKSWFRMRLWVPKGKGTNGQVQAQREVEAGPSTNEGPTKSPVAFVPAPMVGEGRQAIKGGNQAQSMGGSPQVTRVLVREGAVGADERALQQQSIGTLRGPCNNSQLGH